VTPLHPRHLVLLRLRFAIAALFLIPLLVWAEIELAERGWGFTNLASGAAAVVILLAIWLLPRRRYQAWGYVRGEDELVVKHGLLVRQRTIVPFGRVQHTDVRQGPLQRMLGLATLVLSTAGTTGSAVKLPGLLHNEAEELRDHVRSQIRQDLM